MDHARQVEAWNHTAFMAAHLININSPKGSRPVHPQDFHPYGRKRRRPGRANLAAAICPGQAPVSVPASAFNDSPRKGR